MFRKSDLSQYPPMSREAEMETARRAKEGDGDARTELIMRNVRLVVKLAVPYQGRGIEADDLISIGSIGLIKAADTFNPDAGFRFSTYASRCILNEILMELRRLKKVGPTPISLDAVMYESSDGSRLEYNGILRTDPDLVSQAIEQEADSAMLGECLGRLQGRQRDIIDMRYGAHPRTQREISEQLGISQSYISRIEKRAVGQLQESMMAYA